MDTALPLGTTTTSSDAVLPQMEVCTETVAVDPSWYKLVFIFLINLMVSYALAVWAGSKRDDGMTRVGWNSQMADIGGKQRKVVIPIYMQMADYRKMVEGQ